jgi:endonuclease/exonuclease/phosphatase family metal-dependent hydrolase
VPKPYLIATDDLLRFDWSVDGESSPVTVVSVHLDYSRKTVRDSRIDEMVAALSGLESDHFAVFAQIRRREK